MSNSRPLHLRLWATPQRSGENPFIQAPDQPAHARANIQHLQAIDRNGPGLQDCTPPPPPAGRKNPEKAWDEKYKDLHKHNQLVLKELVGQFELSTFYVRTNELAYNTEFNNTKLVLWTGTRGDLETGLGDGFGDDVIIVMNSNGKAIFTRLAGTCSLQEIERAFVQIGYHVNRDLFWAIRYPPVCTVYWFQPLDYETGTFLYPAGNAGQRLRTVQRLLNKWSTEFGMCHVEVRNVFPRKKQWEPAKLYIELVDDDKKKVVIAHDAIGEMRCVPKS